jgi:hypothetical protein
LDEVGRWQAFVEGVLGVLDVIIDYLGVAPLLDGFGVAGFKVGLEGQSQTVTQFSTATMIKIATMAKMVRIRVRRNPGRVILSSNDLNGACAF